MMNIEFFQTLGYYVNKKKPAKCLAKKREFCLSMTKYANRGFRALVLMVSEKGIKPNRIPHKNYVTQWTECTLAKSIDKLHRDNFVNT